MFEFDNRLAVARRVDEVGGQRGEDAAIALDFQLKCLNVARLPAGKR